MINKNLINFIKEHKKELTIMKKKCSIVEKIGAVKSEGSKLKRCYKKVLKKIEETRAEKTACVKENACIGLSRSNVISEACYHHNLDFCNTRIFFNLFAQENFSQRNV